MSLLGQLLLRASSFPISTFWGVALMQARVGRREHTVSVFYLRSRKAPPAAEDRAETSTWRGISRRHLPHHHQFCPLGDELTGPLHSPGQQMTGPVPDSFIPEVYGRLSLRCVWVRDCWGWGSQCQRIPQGNGDLPLQPSSTKVFLIKLAPLSPGSSNLYRVWTPSP